MDGLKVQDRVDRLSLKETRGVYDLAGQIVKMSELPFPSDAALQGGDDT